LELDRQVVAQELIDKQNYEQLKKIVNLQEPDSSFLNYPSKIHFYSLEYNFLINLPEWIRSFQNKVWSGKGSDAFLSNIQPFFPVQNSNNPNTFNLEDGLLKSDCGNVDILTHEWGHNVDFELLLPQNQNQIDPRFTLYDIPFYKTDKSLDFYSISWDSNTVMKNKSFLTYYSMYQPGGDPTYPYPAEDFAETFSMYVNEGNIFRIVAQKDSILKQKYEWMKNNVFNGIEYDTGDSNFPNYIDSNAEKFFGLAYYGHSIDYSIKDFNYRCKFISRTSSISQPSTTALSPNEEIENNYDLMANTLQSIKSAIDELTRLIK